MKTSSFALSAFALLALAGPGWAKGEIREADYPVQYEVVNSSQTSKLMVEKSCSMTLRDRAKVNVAVNVEKKGSCPAIKMFRGRVNQKKNQIELVIPAGKDKASVEEWQIIGTVDITPTAKPQ